MPVMGGEKGQSEQSSLHPEKKEGCAESGVAHPISPPEVKWERAAPTTLHPHPTSGTRQNASPSH